MLLYLLSSARVKTKAHARNSILKLPPSGENRSRQLSFLVKIDLGN